MVIAELKGNDVILCQITSQWIKDEYAIIIEDADFTEGTLKQRSHIRPNRIFTADSNSILYKVGHLKQKKIDEAIEKLIGILHQ